MDLFKKINSDYIYLENIKEGHKKLLSHYENDSWKLIKIRDLKQEKAVCEICGNTNIKRTYQIQDLSEDEYIEVGVGCYRKLMNNSTKKTKDISVIESNHIISAQEEIEERRLALEELFKNFVNNELPILKEKAFKYNILFDDTLTKIQVKEWRELKLAVAKIRVLKKAIEDYEFEKRKKEIYQKKLERSLAPRYASQNNNKKVLSHNTEKIDRKKRRDVTNASEVKYGRTVVSNKSIGEAWRLHNSKGNITYKQKCENMVRRLLSEGHTNKIILRELRQKLGLKSGETKKLIKRLS